MFFVQLSCVDFAEASPFISELEKNEWAQTPLGEDRILVLCLPHHATVKSKRADLLYVSIDWEGYEERDIVIAEVRKYRTHVVREHNEGNAVPRNVVQDIYRISDSNKTKIRDVAQCENRLEYVLIGKDQTRKKRWSLFPSNDDLYSTVDAMPMRRFEMKQKVEKN